MSPFAVEPFLGWEPRLLRGRGSCALTARRADDALDQWITQIKAAPETAHKVLELCEKVTVSVFEPLQAGGKAKR